jgi:hypothetical protein
MESGQGDNNDLNQLKLKIKSQTHKSVVTPLLLTHVSIICNNLGHAAEKKEKKMTLRGIRITHLLLSGQMLYPVRLEGHHNIRLVSVYHPRR